MSEIPSDLVPLPTAPYDKRPSELPLDVEECRTALWRARGNVSRAAQILKIPAPRLRRFVQGSPRLQSEIDEARQQLVDVAEDIAYEALIDATDTTRQDSMAKFIMSNLGKTRGFGSGGGNGVTVNMPKGNLVIQWADGSELSNPAEDAKVVEHEG